MSSKWFENFMNNLKEVLKEPPYLLFFFTISVLMIISLIIKSHFEVILILFLYSIIGVVWRHATKDLRGGCKKLFKNESKKDRVDLLGIIIYQIVNVIFLYYLLHYLKFI